MNRLLVLALIAASLPLAAHPRPWRRPHHRPVLILPPGPVCLPRPHLPRLHVRWLPPRHRHHGR